MNTIDATIRQILQRAEGLYEDFGTPLVGVSRHRRAWAFARAFGATRLAREFGVPRATVVTARRRAFARWHYWMTCYEEPLWQVLMRIAGEPHQWEGCMVRYLHLRALLRQERVPAEHQEAQTDALVACALRSLASVPGATATVTAGKRSGVCSHGAMWDGRTRSRRHWPGALCSGVAPVGWCPACARWSGFR